MSQNNSSANSPGYSRYRIPYLFDLVHVYSPDLVRTVAEHCDITRPDRGVVPAPFSWLLKATQFFVPSHEGGEYAVAFTSTDCNEQKTRRWRVFDHVSRGFSEKQIHDMKRIVRSDISREVAAKELTKIVGSTILGRDTCLQIPDAIVDDIEAFNMNYLFYPWRMWWAWRARKRILAWVSKTMPDEEYPVDVLHDLVTLYHGFTPGLLRLRDCEGDFEQYMAQHPVLPISLRVPKRDTDLGGILGPRLYRGRTVLVMDIGAAATECGSLDFVFGLGSGNRQCPFRPVFMETGEKILKGDDGELVQIWSCSKVDSQ